MKLTHLLSKFGLYNDGAAEPEPPPLPPAPPLATRMMRLDDLRAQDRQGRAEALLEALGLRKTFPEIYRERKIADPPAGVSLDRLAELVAGLQEASARSMVRKTLEEAGAKVLEVLEDGHRRDQALDDYERTLEEEVGEWAQEQEKQAEALLREAQELQLRAGELRARVPEVREELARWRERKQKEEALMELLGRMLLELRAQGSAGPAGA